MAIRRGAEYLAGIQDDREVYLDGERVEDVTTDERLAGCARTLAEMYDLQHDPSYQEALTMKSPTTGDLVSLSYVLPESVDELVSRREMIELLMRRSGGILGRLPEYMASIVVGMYDNRELMAEANPAFAENIVAYMEHCRENDLSLTHSFADASRDTRFSRDQFENLRVVEERSDGIVVRGSKSVATLAPYADEYLSLAPNRPGLASDEIVYFGIPVDRPGLRIHCRPSLSSSDPYDHKLAYSLEEMDAWVVFDNVFVPSDRVFYMQKTEVHLGLLNQIMPWAFYHILIRMACKAEVLAGICASIADYLGREKQELTQLALCEVYGYVETLRAFVYAAERDPVTSPSGLVVPNPTQITMGRIFSVDNHPRILQILRELCGSGILMAPSHVDITHPEVGKDVEKYLVGPDDRALDRFKLLKLAWEYACDSFGSRQLLFEMHNAGSQTTTKARLAATYDASPFKELARSLAGIETTEAGK